jgi:hypothetical protein
MPMFFKGKILETGFFLVACLIVLVIVQAYGQKEISYGFSDATQADLWKSTGSSDINISKNGFLIKTKNSIQLWSPRLEIDTSQPKRNLWDAFSFVKIELSKSEKDRTLALLWRSHMDQLFAQRIPFEVPKKTNIIYVNVPATASRNIASFLNNNVDQIGLEIRDDIELKRITLLSTQLPFIDLVRLSLQYLRSSEYFQLFHVNLVFGFEGRIFFYFIAVLFLGICFIKTTTGVIRSAMIGVFLCYFILDMQVDLGLINHAIESCGKSAWYFPRNKEYESRFGKEFADLAVAFEEKVPEDSRVFFPREKLMLVHGETNWIAFQFFPQYKNVPLRRADYVFYFYPQRLTFDSTQGILKASGRTEKYYKSETLFDGGDNLKVLKVNHV